MRRGKRKIIRFIEPDSITRGLAKQIKNASKGLFYISETDAEITPFVGSRAQTNSKEEILRQTNSSVDCPIAEKEFSEIFERLVKIQDWYGEEEIAVAAKFAELKSLLESNLKNLKVYKIGNIELDVYIVGLNAENVLMGIKTKAVET